MSNKSLVLFQQVRKMFPVPEGSLRTAGTYSILLDTGETIRVGPHEAYFLNIQHNHHPGTVSLIIHEKFGDNDVLVYDSSQIVHVRPETSTVS